MSGGGLGRPEVVIADCGVREKKARREDRLLYMVRGLKDI